MRNILSAVLDWSVKETDQLIYVLCYSRNGHHAMVGFLSLISDFTNIIENRKRGLISPFVQTSICSSAANTISSATN